MLGRGQQASKKGMRKRTFTSPQAKHALSRFELAGHTSIGVLCGSSFIIVNVCVCVCLEKGGGLVFVLCCWWVLLVCLVDGFRFEAKLGGFVNVFG